MSFTSTLCLKKPSFSFCLTSRASLGMFEAPRIQFHVVSYFKSRPEQIDRKSVLSEIKLPVECLQRHEDERGNVIQQIVVFFFEVGGSEAVSLDVVQFTLIEQ